MKNKEINHRTFFDEQSKTWDESLIPEDLQRLKKIFSKFTFNFGSIILDVGCATGILVPLLTKNQIRLLVEYDISKKMLVKNKDKWQNFSLCVKQLNGEAEKLPLNNECFSTIICFAILPHIVDKHAAYQEFYRVLKPGGRLLILHLMGSQKLNQFHKDVGTVVAHDQLRPASAVVSKLEEFGFTIETCKERDDLYLVVAKK